ncbi:MAG: sensor histidine kinase [Lachnospiraceae bacterium]|nr:sensor histidine kinase [Lachnospiraceae bacterium]
MKATGRGSEIKWRMIRLLIFGWLLPMALACVVVSLVMSSRMTEQMKKTATNSLSKVVSLIGSNFEETHKESRNATYLGVISSAYNDYLTDRDEQKLYTDITLYLTGQYRYNKKTDSVMLFFIDNPDLFYSTYDSSTSYNDVYSFKESGFEDVLKISETLDTSMYLYENGGKLYLVRNLVTTSYKPYAVIVMLLNRDEMFGSLRSVWGCKDASVFVDGTCVYGNPEIPDPESFEPTGDTVSFVNKGGSFYTYCSDRIDGRNIVCCVELDKNVILGEKRTGRYILMILLLSMIPLCVTVFWFFNRMITRPVNRLVKAAGEISDENYGYEIEASEGSREFQLVNEAFNGMSRKLKQQFEQIYLEELAVRDANIKALQSQINPHFINNTLEIINWEARLNGVYKVSGMIEALSTMLNATLNRSNIQRIPLCEELKYVDAYLYIISERMGKRLTVDKDIDESMLREPVPRLIAQPIVENAVEHGITTQGNGRISIKVYAEEEYMYLEVRNTGRLSEGDKERVEKILSGQFDEKQERSVSIGISNVNKRLKLMYGDSCGLKIFEDGEETVSLLTFIREGGEEYVHEEE